MENTSPRANMLQRVLKIGIWIKGLDGVLEVIGGVAFLLISNLTLNRAVIILTQHELVEDPHDWIATTLRAATAHLSSNTKLFGGAYLIAHGLVKLFLVAALLRRKPWAYPAAIVFLCLFIAYQFYRLSYNYTSGLMLLTLFDIAIVALIWREYRQLRIQQRN